MLPTNARHLLLVSVGNTRTRFALAADGTLEPSRVVANTDEPALKDALHTALTKLGSLNTGVLIASVNDPLADSLSEMALALGHRAVRFGRGLRVPIKHNLTAPVTVGTDRLLAALGAHRRSAEACVVIDAGTAITVDFIDQWGVFQGGCIAPGMALMLRSLHEHTAALPLVEPPRTLAPQPDESGAEPAEGETAKPNPLPLGRTTKDAMIMGCTAAALGLVHTLIDRYALMNGAYPRVIATGGDAPMLFENDELVEHIVPDLVLIGMLAAWEIEGGASAA